MAVDTNGQKAERTTGVSASVKVEPTAVALGINVNPWYFQSIPGLLKLAQLVFGIICMACGSPAYFGFAHFFLFVVVLSFMLTLFLCLVYLCSVKDLLPRIPWLQAEFIYTAAATVLYFIAMIVMLTMTSEGSRGRWLSIVGHFNSYIVAGVFGLFNTVAYGAGTFFLFQEYKGSLPAVSQSAATQQA